MSRKVLMPRNEDFTAHAFQGNVLLDWPGVSCSFPPETALHMADLLTKAAAEALKERSATRSVTVSEQSDQSPDPEPSSMR